MKNCFHAKFLKYALTFLCILAFKNTKAQINNNSEQPIESPEKKKSVFWSKVRFGGNAGLNFANNSTNIVLAPTAIYQVNPKFNVGAGINLGYTKFGNQKGYVYGANIVSQYQPIRGMQLSAELHETGVSQTIKTTAGDVSRDYWYPSIFVGAGYTTGNFTAGLKYDLLYDRDKSIYSEAFVPFVSVFF